MPAVLSENDRKFPEMTGRSGTQRARHLRLAHDGWHLGALVLVATQRPTHNEGVTVRCSQAQSLRELTVRRLLLVTAVGCWRRFGGTLGARADNCTIHSAV